MVDMHNRRSIRLRGYDYSLGGAYFITIRAKDGACVFGTAEEGAMHVNPAGQIVRGVWEELPSHYPNVLLDAFIVMPNHVHGIIVITAGAYDKSIVGAGFKPAPTTVPKKRHALPEIVRGLKTFSSRRINEMRGDPGIPLWQRNYYEHIIRNENSLDKIRRYISDNPAQWMADRDNPAAVSPEPKDIWR